MLDELVGCVVDWVSALLAVCEAKEKKNSTFRRVSLRIRGTGTGRFRRWCKRDAQQLARLVRSGFFLPPGPSPATLLVGLLFSMGIPHSSNQPAEERRGLCCVASERAGDDEQVQLGNVALGRLLDCQVPDQSVKKLPFCLFGCLLACTFEARRVP